MVQARRPARTMAGIWRRWPALIALCALFLVALPGAGYSGAVAQQLTAGSVSDAGAASGGASVRSNWASLGALKTAQAATPFSVTARRAEDGALVLDWTIRSDSYLYRDSVTISENGNPLSFTLPPGEEKDDVNFGRVRIFQNALRAILPAAELEKLTADGALQAPLHVTWQGCSQAGICYPPQVGEVSLAALGAEPVKLTPAGPSLGNRVATPIPGAGTAEVPGAAAETPAVPLSGAAVSPVRVASATDTPSADESAWSPSALLTGDPLWMLAAFLGFGLLLSLTPCVFPMIPILGGVLARAGAQADAQGAQSAGSSGMGRGVALSSVYVLAMACAYGLLGLVAGWSGANLQAALQTPWALGAMAVVFVVLALSMFGLFDMQMPAALSSRLSGRLPGAGGSFSSAAMLGFGSALIVGPCVTPPLAAAMLTAAQTGAAGRGAAALFMLGLGMGLPLIAFGAFGARVLPKSGPWLARVKMLFGVVFLAVAVYLATRLMDEAQALGIWGVFAIGLAVFLGGFDRMEAGMGWHARLGKASGLVLAVYGALLLVGSAGGAGDPLRPLSFLSSGGQGAQLVRQEVPAQRVTSMAALDMALEQARAEGRPALVSFTADWCTVCKSNEKVLKGPDLAPALARTTFIAADVTDYGVDSRALMERFGIIGPPTMFVVDATGREVPGTRMIGAINAQDVTRNIEAAQL
ncbi:protein-disulfide reductase DsbD [Xanthobacter sp. TB0139]|uniref:protein-disulfide reductase DsbD n=1 Tax=Xanthobacter sp. TB0139 TaxID=3459178 RepID=UPI0040392628